MAKTKKVQFLQPPSSADYNPPSNMRVTREDWLNVALDVLISDGVERVKVLSLRKKLCVSRSSFYWYFKSRQQLLDALLDFWQNTNTAALIKQANIQTARITEAVCNVFKCTIDPDLFDTSLDFAIRDWARRSGKVRRILDQSDETRLKALTQMYSRFGYEPVESETRARVLYYMQIGYNEADLNEPMSRRMQLVSSYLKCFTGIEANQEEVDSLIDYAKAVVKRTDCVW